MTLRLRLDLAYDGTDYHGWAAQKDPDLPTVQGKVEEALSLVLREPIRLTVAGRTDAGVHATGQVAHFDVSPAALDQRSIAGDPSRLVRRLAKLLPSSISVRDCQLAPPGFDARFSALRRHYRYRITTHPAGPQPVRARDTATWNRAVCVESLQQAADALVGLHDFAAFCKHRVGATTVRDLQEFTWRDISTEVEPQVHEAHVVADAFCWNMVRSLVGCCLAVAEGRLGIAEVHRLLQEDARSDRIPLAPACGLTLAGVDYPEAEELARRAVETRAKRQLER